MLLCYPGIEGSSFVAVKTLKESAGDKERQDLLKELQVMKSLKPHPNIVTLLGCCTDKGNPLSNPLYSPAKTIRVGQHATIIRRVVGRRNVKSFKCIFFLFFF